MSIRTGNTAWDITTDRLTVRVARPGCIYRRTRFDWTGFITDVILDGRHTFCSVESLHPLEGAGGVGLCNEFGIHEPVGYTDAAVGDRFPKLGIGLLAKPDDAPYFFMRDYPLEPFACDAQLLGNGIRFELAPAPCRGYAVRLVKTLTVAGNEIRMGYRLANEGERPVETTEYNHNFLLLNGHPVGPDHVVTFTAPLTFRRNDGTVWTESGVLAAPENPKVFYGLCETVPAVDAIGWTLRHGPSGLAVSERLDARPVRIACWGMPHVISPELFHGIRLQPGETAEWNRIWTFNTRDE